MKQQVWGLLLICATSLLSGNGNGGGNTNNTLTLPPKVTDAINAPASTLSQAAKETLAYMYSEEWLAHDVYLAIYETQAVAQLYNIATRSEVQHIEAVNQLAIKYDLNMKQYPQTDTPYTIDNIGNGIYPIEDIQLLYNILYEKGIGSIKDALEVGCMVEAVDIEDLNRDIEIAKASNANDVVTVFEFLRSGSYSHYNAFDKGLKTLGIQEGCCSLPNAFGYSFCLPAIQTTNKQVAYLVPILSLLLD